MLEHKSGNISETH